MSIAIAACIAAILALIAGGVWYVRKSANNSVELEQARAIIEATVAAQKKQEEANAKARAERDEEFNAKLAKATDAERAAALLREVAARTRAR